MHERVRVGVVSIFNLLPMYMPCSAPAPKVTTNKLLWKERKKSIHEMASYTRQLAIMVFNVLQFL